MRGWGARAVAVLAVLLAGAGLWASACGAQPRSAEEQTRAVAATLRCPSCAGEDVANSSAPLAVAMRTVVADQVEQGRSPEQIRAWFAQRYGDEVLLDPPRRGAGWLLWVLPAALVGATVAVVVLRRAPGRRAMAGTVAAGAIAVVGGTWALTAGAATAPVTPTVPAEQRPPVDATSVLADAVAEAPGDLDLRLALAGTLADQGHAGAAAEQYAAAARLRPFDAEIGTQQALSLVRAGSPDRARPVLEDVVALQPDHAPALLLLGTLLWRDGEERGGPLLQRFLELAPDHPAASDVRTMLATAPAGTAVLPPVPGSAPTPEPP